MEKHRQIEINLAKNQGHVKDYVKKNNIPNLDVVIHNAKRSIECKYVYGVFVFMISSVLITSPNPAAITFNVAW
jgi:hypothetical protein